MFSTGFFASCEVSAVGSGVFVWPYPLFRAYLVNLLAPSQAQTEVIVFNSALLASSHHRRLGGKTWELLGITAGVPNTWLRDASPSKKIPFSSWTTGGARLHTMPARV